MLFINLPTDSFDINVHPTKIEARFSQKWNIINFINNNIKNELKKILKVLPDINFTSKIDSIDNDLKLDLGLSTNLDLEVKVADYHQHAISSGSDAKAVAYSEISYKEQSVWGVGIHQNTVIAGLESVINGLNRLSI